MDVLLQVIKLMERVELTFTKHFSNSNRRKAMDTLRPKAKKERHRISFSIGKSLNKSNLNFQGQFSVITFVTESVLWELFQAYLLVAHWLSF